MLREATPDSQIFISKLTPVGDQELNIERELLNAKVEKKIREMYSTEIKFIDHSNLAKQGNPLRTFYNQDQLHLSKEGAVMFCDNFEAAIETHIRGTAQRNAEDKTEGGNKIFKHKDSNRRYRWDRGNEDDNRGGSYNNDNRRHNRNYENRPMSLRFNNSPRERADYSVEKAFTEARTRMEMIIEIEQGTGITEIDTEVTLIVGIVATVIIVTVTETVKGTDIKEVMIVLILIDNTMTFHLDMFTMQRIGIVEKTV